MPHTRYYVDDPLLEGNSISIEEQEFHHLSRVMRGRIGDSLEIVNGKGVLAKARVIVIEKQKAMVNIEKRLFQEKKPIEIILVQGIPRINHLEVILEKGTELGMTKLWLLPTEKSEKHEFSHNQMKRIHSIPIAAMKQCGRLYLPEIELKPSLVEWKNLNYPAYYGDVAPNAPPILKTIKKEEEVEGIFFFIGPEGGFTEKEEKQLQRLGVKGVKLHDNILRTETAALASLTIISSILIC